VKLQIKTWPSLQLKSARENFVLYRHEQSTINISSEYLWIKEKDELINSLFPKFPHILCFSEHHLKHIELDQINLEGYKLGAAYCRKSLLKGRGLHLCS
jgi:hypothetical protein